MGASCADEVYLQSAWYGRGHQVGALIGSSRVGVVFEVSESKVRYLVMKHQVRRGVQDGVVTVVGGGCVCSDLEF